MALASSKDKDTRTLAASDMTGTLIQVKNWQESDLSKARIKISLPTWTTLRAHLFLGPHAQRYSSLLLEEPLMERGIACAAINTARYKSSARGESPMPPLPEQVHGEITAQLRTANHKTEWGLGREEALETSQVRMLPALTLARIKAAASASSTTARQHSGKTRPLPWRQRHLSRSNGPPLLHRGLRCEGHIYNTTAQTTSTRRQPCASIETRAKGSIHS